MSKQEQEFPAEKTILLLEQNKIDNNDDPNGTFSINLSNPITLNEGDSLTLNKSFIDTSLQNLNFIRVEEDEEILTIKTGIYYTDIELNPTPSTKPTFGKWSVEAAQRPQGDTYILNNQSDATLNTFLDWSVSNQPTIVGGTDFNLELKPLSDAAPTSPLIGIAQYVLVGAPDLGDAPTDPPGFGQTLQQKFLLGGYLNMKTISGSHEFYYYHRTAVAADFSDPQGHIAVFEGWFDGNGARKGWKAKANPNTTFPSPNPPYQRWYFQSDTFGYNYFADRGNGHLMRLQTLRFPLYSPWDSSESSSTLDYYPAVGLKYTDPTTGKVVQKTKNFNKYPPVPEPNGGFNTNAAMEELEEIFSDKRLPPQQQNQRIKHEDLPDQFKDKSYGWSREWHWYDWKQWQDPRDTASILTFPAIEFSIDDPPVLAFSQFNAAGTQPIFQGFINGGSQHAVKSAAGVLQGTKIQPYQMPDLIPVSNPTSNGSTMTPREYETTIRIPKGDYSYTGLAQLMTDQLNSLNTPVTGLRNQPTDLNQPLNAAGFSNSYLLQTTYELMQQYDGLASVPIANVPNFPNNFTFSKVALDARTAADGTAIPAIPARSNTDEGVQPYFVSEDATRLFSFNGTNVFPGGSDKPWLLGAENFSIIYDESSQQFKFEQMHTPIYIDGPVIDSTTTPPTKGPGSVVIQQMKGATNDDSFLGSLKTLDSATGCFLTDLQPRSLWFGKMGFDASILTPIGTNNSNVVDFTSGTSDFSDGTLQEVKCFPVSLKTGRNKTGYFISNDSLVRKNAEYYELDDAWNELIETDELVGLNGRPLLATIDDDPFYQIEISGVNKNNITGQVYDDSLVQAMVGKYFSAGNFTQSIGDGFQYVHKGEPMVIKDLRVRILNSQNQLEQNLGPNSAFSLTLGTTK